MSQNTPIEQSTMSPSTTEHPSIACTGPADELIDPKQQRLINELIDLLEPFTEINSATWAFLWLASQESLQNLIIKDKDSHRLIFNNCLLEQGLSVGVLSVLKAWARRVDLKDQQWLQSMNRNSQRIFGYANAKLNTSKDNEPPCKKRRVELSDSDGDAEGDVDPAEELCKQKDDTSCVLTGFRGPIVVARIFPYDLDQMKDTQKQIQFWHTLALWHTNERIESWKKQINSTDPKTSCANMLCMSIHAYHLWLKARFALRPKSLSEDKTHLTVQFYWLPQRRYKKKMNPREIPRAFPNALSASYTVDGKVSAMLFNLDKFRALCSGDLLVFKTDDPVARPLPALELMEMQWCLHRMLALSGLPDATDEQFNPKEWWMEGYESEEGEEDSEDDC